jgi:hypothetical protein
MENDIFRLAVIVVLGWAAWYTNRRLNPIPELQKVLDVVIIVVAVLFSLNPILDIIRIALHS